MSTGFKGIAYDPAIQDTHVCHNGLIGLLNFAIFIRVDILCLYSFK